MKPLCAIILAGSFLLSAAGEPNDKTFGMSNGRVWNALPPDVRYGSILGLYHGWNLRGNTEDVFMSQVWNAFLGKFPTVEVAQMVTSIYADTENLVLPIGWVVLASHAVQRGETNWGHGVGPFDPFRMEC